MQTVFDMLSQINEFFHAEVFIQFVEKMPLITGLMALGFLFHFLPSKLYDYSVNLVSKLPLAGKILLLTAAIWLAAQFKSADIQPFIYFQF
jgi:hypothetical protein